MTRCMHVYVYMCRYGCMSKTICVDASVCAYTYMKLFLDVCICRNNIYIYIYAMRLCFYVYMH